MISWLRGSVSAIETSAFVLDVGAFGLHIHCTPSTALSLTVSDHIEVATSLVVRDDGWTLYGFLDTDERNTFDTVQTVSGIGPRLALTLLGTLTPDELRAAVASEDLATLTTVSGIGRKGAQRLVLELADRLGPAAGSVEALVVSPSSWQESVRAALMSLGWQSAVAQQAVDALPAPQGEPDIAALLKAALVSLDRR
jgi:Holliday junction DNA helicase RuvA